MVTPKDISSPTTPYGTLLSIKSGLDSFFSFTLVVENKKYRTLSTEHQTIFDHFYPHLSRRERYLNLFSESSELLVYGATTLFSVYGAAVYLGLVAFSLMLGWASVSLLALGLFVLIVSRFCKVCFVDRFRSQILAESHMEMMFKAYDEISKDTDSLRADLFEINGLYTQLKKRGDEYGVLAQEVIDWIKDAEFLLSDDSIRVVKDCILQQRDLSDSKMVVIDKKAKLKDEIQSYLKRFFYPGSADDAKKKRDAITKLDNFRQGWFSLTKLPFGQVDESSINYLLLWSDYLSEKDRVIQSVSALKLFCAALNSPDSSIAERAASSVSAILQTIRDEKLALPSRLTDCVIESEESDSYKYLVSQRRFHELADKINQAVVELDLSNFKKNDSAESRQDHERHKRGPSSY